MILNLEQMHMITRGAVRVEENDGVFSLLRFTEKQAQAYLDLGCQDFYNKSFATSGVRLAFRTDSKSCSFDYTLKSASSRAFAYFDVYENGLLVKHFGTEGGELKGGKAKITFGEGSKDVEIYLPWSRRASLSNVEIDDGAVLEGLSRKYTMINFGDSITHGYDAIYPSLSYASRLARLMDADAVNKGIGADTFCPELLEEPDPFTPDFVTVAYGTNDWHKRTYDELKEKSRAFYSRLSEMYPTARIFGITPICRLDGNKPSTLFGAPAYEVDALIREVCADLPNVTVIRGWTLTPALKEFYSDLRLHPNDLGFGVYAQNLYGEIMKTL